MTPRAASSTSIGVALAFGFLLHGCKGADRSDDHVLPAADSAMAREVAALRVGEERQVADGVFMTMNRQQAAEPIGDGWNRAESKDGGFSVELPLAFNDFRIRSNATDGVEVRSHSVGAKTKGLLAWTATCVVRRDGSRPPGEVAGAPDKTEVKGDPPKAYQRTIQLEGRTCVLILEAQGSDPLPPEADRERFLRSFEMLRPPVW